MTHVLSARLETISSEVWDEGWYTRAMRIDEVRQERDRLLEVLNTTLEQVTYPENAQHTLGAFCHGSRVAEMRELVSAARAAGWKPQSEK